MSDTPQELANHWFYGEYSIEHAHARANLLEVDFAEVEKHHLKLVEQEAQAKSDVGGC